MTHTLDIGLAAGTVGSLLYIVLGVWVLTLTPRRRQTLLLGAFAVLIGVGYSLADILFILDVIAFGTYEVVVFGPFVAAGSFAVLALAATVAQGSADRRPLLLAAAFGFGFSTLTALTFVFSDLSYLRSIDSFLAISLTHTWNLLIQGATLAAAILLAFRAGPANDHDRGDVLQFALLSVGFAFYTVVGDGAGITDAARAVALGQSLAAAWHLSAVVAWLVVAGVWARNVMRASPATVRVHRAALLAILGLLLGGALFEAAIGYEGVEGRVMFGATRTLGVGLLAYGVLRHDLAGLDAKVEWTVSKTTVAGVFVAVFFIVSEGAQVLFADFAQNEILGVIAAGALLFALSPIQRAADRVAQRAVPGGKPSTPEDRAEAEQIYRETVAKFLADGEITDDEEETLAKLATRLGLDPERTLRLQNEVEGELGGGS